MLPLHFCLNFYFFFFLIQSLYFFIPPPDHFHMLVWLSAMFDCYCDTPPFLRVHKIVILIYIWGL